jgi:hypothetical protein
MLMQFTAIHPFNVSIHFGGRSQILGLGSAYRIWNIVDHEALTA